MMKRKIKLLSILLTVMLVLTAALPALGETLTVHYLQDERGRTAPGNRLRLIPISSFLTRTADS